MQFSNLLASPTLCNWRLPRLSALAQRTSSGPSLKSLASWPEMSAIYRKSLPQIPRNVKINPLKNVRWGLLNWIMDGVSRKIGFCFVCLVVVVITERHQLIVVSKNEKGPQFLTENWAENHEFLSLLQLCWADLKILFTSSDSNKASKKRWIFTKPRVKRIVNWKLCKFEKIRAEPDSSEKLLTSSAAFFTASAMPSEPPEKSKNSAVLPGKKRV